MDEDDVTFEKYVSTIKPSKENFWKLLKDFNDSLKYMFDNGSIPKCMFKDSFIVKTLPNGKVLGQLKAVNNTEEESKFYGTVLMNSINSEKDECKQILKKFVYCLLYFINDLKFTTSKINSNHVFVFSEDKLEPFRVEAFKHLFEISFEENLRFEKFNNHIFWWSLEEIKKFINITKQHFGNYNSDCDFKSNNNEYDNWKEIIPENIRRGEFENPENTKNNGKIDNPAVSLVYYIRNIITHINFNTHDKLRDQIFSDRIKLHSKNEANGQIDECLIAILNIFPKLPVEIYNFNSEDAKSVKFKQFYPHLNEGSYSHVDFRDDEGISNYGNIISKIGPAYISEIKKLRKLQQVNKNVVGIINNKLENEIYLTKYANFHSTFEDHLEMYKPRKEMVWKLLQDFCEGLKGIHMYNIKLSLLTPKKFVVQKYISGCFSGQIFDIIKDPLNEEMEFYGTNLLSEIEEKTSVDQKIAIKFICCIFCLITKQKILSIKNNIDIKDLSNKILAGGDHLEVFRIYLFHELINSTFKGFRKQTSNGSEEIITFKEFQNHSFWWSLLKIEDFIEKSEMFMFKTSNEPKRTAFKKNYEKEFKVKGLETKTCWWDLLEKVYKECSYFAIKNPDIQNFTIPLNQQNPAHALKYIKNFINHINDKKYEKLCQSIIRKRIGELNVYYNADEFTIDALNIFPNLLVNVFSFNIQNKDDPLLKKFYVESTTGRNNSGNSSNGSCNSS